MDVIWATSNLPDPTLGGGAALEHELLRRAARSHAITLVTGGLAHDEPVPAPLLDLGLVEVVPAGAPRRAQPGRIGTLVRSLAGPPFEFWMAGPKVASVGREVARRQTELVHVMWAESAPVAVAAASRGPTAFLATDSFTRHEERELAQAVSARQRLYRRLQLARTRRWERRYRHAGAVAAVSPLDAAAFTDLGVPATVVPVILGDEWFAPPTEPRQPDRVSFIAALDYGPNQDAVRWLLTEIWPRLRDTRPGTELHVVGRNPSAEIRTATEQAGAVLHADVDDIRPHYWRSSAVLIPVRLGSGTRTKVLHAMACGTPVVSTRTACEGLPVTSGEQALLADDGPGLVEAVVEVLDAPVAAEAARPGCSAAGRGPPQRARRRCARGSVGPSPGNGPMTTSRPQVCVVCPTHQRSSLLPRLVRALEEQSYPSDLVEVRIVDDCSTDDTAAVLADLAAASPLRLVPMRTEANSGPARARNVGWRSTTAPIVAFTDDDCVPSAEWLASGVAALGQAPGAGVAQGPVERPVSAPLGPWSVFRENPGPTPFFEGCNVFYRREALEETGGFAEDIAWYGEDAEAGWRVLDAGWDRTFAADAVVVHDVDERGVGWHIRNGYLERNLIGVGARHPRFAEEAYWRPWAWKRETAAMAAAVVGGLGASRLRPLALLAVPWLWLRWPRRGYRALPLLGPQRAAVDVAQLAGHVAGSLRHRRVVL